MNIDHRRWIRAALLLALPALSPKAAFSIPSPGTQEASSTALKKASDSNPDPDIFETNLVAREEKVTLANGLTARAYTFNGRVPGPEIRVQVGNLVIVHFTNSLPEASSIHWHGIEVNNESDGTGVTQDPVESSSKYTYQFIVTRPGVFWYHSHIKPTNPEFKGQYGSFIVEDPAEDILREENVLPRRKRTKTLILADTTVCKEPGSNDTETFPADPNLPWAGTEEGLGDNPGLDDDPDPDDLCESPLDNDGNPLGTGALASGEIPNIQTPATCAPPGCRVNEGQLVLVNGRVPAGRSGSPAAPGILDADASFIRAAAGEGVRLQVINAAVSRYFRLSLTDEGGSPVPLYRVGGEGGLLERVRLEGGIQGTLDTKYDLGEILLAPGDREDLVVQVPLTVEGEILTLWTKDYARIGAGSSGFPGLPTVPLAHLKIKGPAKPKHVLTIAAGDPLLLHPSVNRSIENLKLLPITDHLIDPATLGEPGSPDETIELNISGSGKPSIDGVDGSVFDHGGSPYTTIPHIDSSRFATSGDLLHLRVVNDTSAHHPFHPHGFSFQPVRIVDNATGVTEVQTFTYNEFVDTLDIPSGHTLVYRWRLEDRPLADGFTPGGSVGRWVFHCHIFFHAAHGMISELVVLP